MNTTAIIFSAAIGGAGLIVAVITTIKGFRDAKKSVNERILRRKNSYHLAE